MVPQPETLWRNPTRFGKILFWLSWRRKCFLLVNHSYHNLPNAAAHSNKQQYGSYSASSPPLLSPTITTNLSNLWATSNQLPATTHWPPPTTKCPPWERNKPLARWWQGRVTSSMWMILLPILLTVQVPFEEHIMLHPIRLLQRIVCHHPLITIPG